MMTQGMVSVITPMFNCEKYIGETICSIIDQTYQKWEMIIVDDCSTDNSVDIVKRYIEKDSRIRLIALEKNSGAAIARNTAMAQATGQYLAFVDSDDLWYPEKLEKQVVFMQKQNVGFCYSNYNVSNQFGQIQKCVLCNPWMDYKKLLTGYPMMCGTVILDREKVGMIQMPLLRSGQDFATWASILRNRRCKAINVNETLAIYRERPESLSSNKLKAFKRTWIVMRRYENLNLFRAGLYIAIYSSKWVKKQLRKGA